MKETKEAALGLIYVAKELAKAYKLASADGKIDINDLPLALATVMKPEFVANIQSAVDGVDKIGEELKALDILGGFDLGREITVAVLEALKEIRG